MHRTACAPPVVSAAPCGKLMQHLCRRTVLKGRSASASASCLVEVITNSSEPENFANSHPSYQLNSDTRARGALYHKACLHTGDWQQSSACQSQAHKVLSSTFATKAEEYDLIVADAGLVRIEGYDETGFIVNDVQIQGAVFCVNDLFMMWNVASWQELTPDSLSMLHLFKPAPDLVIIGCGLYSQMVPPELRNYFKQHNLAYEAIDTANAVSTFNILNQEGRKVAGVMLPAGSS